MAQVVEQWLKGIREAEARSLSDRFDSGCCCSWWRFDEVIKRRNERPRIGHTGKLMNNVNDIVHRGEHLLMQQVTVRGHLASLGTTCWLADTYEVREETKAAVLLFQSGLIRQLYEIVPIIAGDQFPYSHEAIATGKLIRSSDRNFAYALSHLSQLELWTVVKTYKII